MTDEELENCRVEFLIMEEHEIELWKREMYPEFENRLINAVRNFGADYFLLPMDQFNLEIIYKSKERVYAYELYHRLKITLGDDFAPFILSGEVDKNLHYLYAKHKDLKGVKPDILLHIPGYVEGNFVVIEIKRVEAVDGNRKDTLKDLKKLSLMVSDRYINYYRGIYIIFGEHKDEYRNFPTDFGKLCKEIAEAPANKSLVDLDLIDLYFHPSIEECLIKIPWKDILPE